MIRRIRLGTPKVTFPKYTNFFKDIRLSLFKLLKNKYVRILIGILAIITLIFLARSEHVLVKGYNCKTQYGPTCDKKDTDILQGFVGTNFFTLNLKTLESDLKTNFVNEQVAVQRVIPGKINAFIVKRKPIIGAKMIDKEAPGYFLVDKEGVVISFVPDSALGILNYRQAEHNLVVGAMADEKFKKASQILYSNLRSFGAKDARLEGNLLKVTLPEEIVVNYPLDRDILELSGALQLILTRSRIDGKLPREIDLRFKNPVLTY